AIGGTDHTVSGQAGDNTVTGTAEANSTVTIRSGAATLGMATADSNGNWIYSLTAANIATVGEGSGKTLTATATDAAGNVSGNTTSFSFTLDTTAPAAPTVALTNDTGNSNTDHITSNGTLAVTGVESGASVQYSTNGGATWTSSFSAVEGANTVLVRQVDVAGNATTTPASFSFTLDTTIATPTEIGSASRREKTHP